MNQVPESEKPKRNVFDYIKIAVDVAAYPLAAAAAYYVGRTSLRSSLYKDIARTGVFNEDQAKLKADKAAIMNNPAITDAPQRLYELNEGYRQVVKGVIEGRGFRHIGHYMQGLSEIQNINALVFAGGAAGVVVTTMLSISNSKALLERTSRAKWELEQEGLGR